VTVVRLIVKNTIEEAVLGLHEAKRELARGVLEGAAAAAALSTLELVDLIRSGGASEADLDEEWSAEGGVEEANDLLTGVEGEGDESQPLQEAPAPVAAAAAAPAAGPEPVLGAEGLEELIGRLSASLGADLASRRLSNPLTVRVYERVARRFLDFARAELARGEAARDMGAWATDYLDALRSGRFPAPSSEPISARPVLSRLARLARG